jgi:U4/U6.U5 tri-snRNP component SNU23
MKRREGSLELDKNLNKTMVVQNAGNRGPGVPGFYCEACSRTYKDSAGYLDHINSRARTPASFFHSLVLERSHVFALVDLRRLGQTTKTERSTVEQVRARIAFLREKTKEASAAKSFDFEQRLKEVKAKEAALRADKKAQKKAAKDRVREELAKDVDMDAQNDIAAMMGFGGFGSSKK